MLTEFAVRGSFTMNFAAAHKKERGESRVRRELVGGSRGMHRVPGECFVVGLQRLKHVQSLDVKSEPFAHLWPCQPPVPEQGVLHCHWSSSFMAGHIDDYIQTSRETPVDTQPGFYFNNCN